MRPGVLFTSQLDCWGPLVVRVAASNSVACQLALDAFRKGVIAGAMSASELHMRPKLEQVVLAGIAGVTAEVFDQASHAPQLTSRQCELLHLIALGSTNEQLAEMSHISLSTLKREVRSLLRWVRWPRDEVCSRLYVPI